MPSSHYAQIAMNHHKPSIAVRSVNGGICINSGWIAAGNDLWFVHSPTEAVFL